MTHVAYDCCDLRNRDIKAFPSTLNGKKIILLDKNKVSEIPVYVENCYEVYHLSLGYNSLSSLHHLNQFYSLRILSVPGNNITEINGLQNLKNLTWLDLSKNNIQNIAHLDHNCNLRHLDLSENQILDITDLSHLLKLKSLLLHANNIKTMNNVSRFLPHSLEIFSMANNSVSSYVDLFSLIDFCNLSQFSIMGNPSFCCEDHSYRAFILVLLPNLYILDGSEVSSEDQNLSKDLAKSSLFTNLSDYSPTVADSLIKKELVYRTRKSMERTKRPLTASAIQRKICEKQRVSQISQKVSNSIKKSREEYDKVTVNPLLVSDSVLVPSSVDLSVYSSLTEVSFSFSRKFADVPTVKKSEKLPQKRHSLIDDVDLIKSCDSDDVNTPVRVTPRSQGKKMSDKSVSCRDMYDKMLDDIRFSIANLNDAYSRNKNVLDGEVKLRKIQNKAINFLLHEVENLKAITLKTDPALSVSNSNDSEVLSGKGDVRNSMEILGETIRFSADNGTNSSILDPDCNVLSGEQERDTISKASKHDELTIEDVTELDAVRQAAIEAINLSIDSSSSEEDNEDAG